MGESNRSPSPQSTTDPSRDRPPFTSKNELDPSRDREGAVSNDAHLAADNIYESLKSSSKDSTVTFGGGGGGGGGGDPIECTAPGTVLEREYVYGPNYIDEQVAQFGNGRYYVLQDANYNVVALTDATGQIHRQFSYEPYGDLFAAEKGPSATAINLSSANLDDELDNWQQFEGFWEDHQTHLLDGRGRVLTYYGRYLQRDPYETAMLFATASRMNAMTPALMASLTPGDQYVNGLHIYEFAGSNPGLRSDPTGLFWDDDVDDLGDEITGHRIYTLGALNEGAKWASLGLNLALDIGGSLLGVDAYKSFALLASGQGGFWDALEVVAAVAPGLGPIRAIAKGAKFRRAAKGANKVADLVADVSKTFRKWQKGYDKAKLEEAKRLSPKLKGKTHNHHVIPKYLGGEDGPIVEVNAAYHQLITNAFRRKWPYGQKRRPNADELEEILDYVYGLLPLPTKP